MKKYKMMRNACFFSYLSMSSVFSLPPLLFVTFHEMYGISYTLLGTLLFVNFTTQLLIDLVFTFFSKHFNIKLTVRIMPLITTAGLLLYALVPAFFPAMAAAGLIAGTVIFSVSAGLSEVLLSPLVAAIPSEHPDRDMSMLHSLYGWGVVTVVILSSVYFRIFGTVNWVYLALFFSALPAVASIMFFLSDFPDVNLGNEDSSRDKASSKRTVILICAVCIFLGSSSENIMTGWISSFMEKGLSVPKATGDILGMALFAIMLAVTRNIYAKYGKNIYKTLIIGMAGAVVCYICAGSVNNTVIAFAACILTGAFTSMLWPGTLILMEECAPAAGVAAYALMAACGDFGASLAPQFMGIAVDKISVTEYASAISARLNVLPETVGLKTGMLLAAVFPALGLVWLIVSKRKIQLNKTERKS